MQSLSLTQPVASPASAQTSPYSNIGGPVGGPSPLDQPVNVSQLAPGDASGTVGDIGGSAGPGSVGPGVGYGLVGLDDVESGAARPGAAESAGGGPG